MKIYLVTWLFEPHQGEVLTKLKKRERLLNYYHTKEKEKRFEKYISSGRGSDEKGEKE